MLTFCLKYNTSLLTDGRKESDVEAVDDESTLLLAIDPSLFSL